MSSNAWPIFSIGELIEKKIILGHKDGNFGSFYPRVDEFTSVGVPLLTAKSIVGNKIDIDNAPRLPEGKLEKLKIGIIQEGDVLLSHNATVGRVAVTPKLNGPVLIGTSLTYFRLDQNKISPDFFAAYLSGVDFQNELSSVMGQTTRNQVPISTQRILKVVVPPILEQRKIAKILSSFSQKIELNNQINETLESIARAIYKEWFIDFGPVKAKAEGNKPFAMNDETAALFPDSFEESEFGLIPKGWRFQEFGEITHILNGFAFKSEDYKENGVFILRTKNFSESGYIERSNDDVYLSEEKAKEFDSYLVQPFDIHLVMVAASIGKTSIFTPCELPALRNQNMWCFRKRDDFESQHFINMMLPGVVSELRGFSSGSARDFFRKGDFEKKLIVVPCSDLIKKFNNIVNNLFEAINNNISENKNLTKLRDLLLPKLISGEIELKD